MDSKLSDLNSKEAFVNHFQELVTVVDDSELEQARKRAEDKKRAERLNLFNSLVPSRYRTESLVFDGDPKLLDKQGSIIYGLYGVGKTWTGYSVAKELYIAGKASKFTIQREMEILNTIRNHPEEVNDKYKSVDLLVIDEFGKINNTEFTAGQIFNIIDYRYDWHKRTILICNAESKEDLVKIVPLAMQDRFKGSVFFMGGKSRRVPE